LDGLQRQRDLKQSQPQLNSGEVAQLFARDHARIIRLD
jgi:hypothetical protein